MLLHQPLTLSFKINLIPKVDLETVTLFDLCSLYGISYIRVSFEENNDWYIPKDQFHMMGNFFLLILRMLWLRGELVWWHACLAYTKARFDPMAPCKLVW